MWFIWLTDTLFYGNTALSIAFLCGFGILTVASILAFCLRSVSVFSAFSALLCGGGVVLALILQIPWGETGVFFAITAGLIGFVYLFLFVGLTIREKIDKRKKERAKIERRLQFALPDKDNSFVRARLNTVLRLDERPDFVMPALENDLSFSHARALLAKVREAPLSTAERLETEEIAKMVALYLQKKDFTAQDTRTLNEAFARILKLSAKYAV